MSTRSPFGEKPKNINTHDLVKTGDPEVKQDDLGKWPPFCDRNGEVVLAFCRRCRGGEAELFDQSCLERLIAKAVAHQATLTPLEQAIESLRSKRSWVVGELMMNDDASPNGRTREVATALAERCDPGLVLLAEFERRNAEELKAADGTTRKAHYGFGRQPWDDIKDNGWGPEFCAGNVLKYLRRSKDPKHSVESARVYYKWLVDLATDSDQSPGDLVRATYVLETLVNLLTVEECRIVTGVSGV